MSCIKSLLDLFSSIDLCVPVARSGENLHISSEFTNTMINLNKDPCVMLAAQQGNINSNSFSAQGGRNCYEVDDIIAR